MKYFIFLVSAVVVRATRENGVGPESIGNNIVNIETDTTSQNFIGYGSCLDNIGNRYDRTWFDDFQGLTEDESRDACYNKCLT